MNPARAYDELNAMEVMAAQRSAIHQANSCVKIIATAIFLLALLSVNSHSLPILLGMAIYPFLLGVWAGVPTGFLFKRAMYALPFVIFIGVFNPVFDREPVLYLGSFGISGGWISFFSIILRGVIAVWMALVLLCTTGFYEICSGLRRLRVPDVLTTQFLFVFRYIFLLATETMRMLQARSLRNPESNRSSLPEWSSISGSLLARSLDRADRLNRVLESRGFDGEMKTCRIRKISSFDVLFLMASITVIALLRYGGLADKVGAILTSSSL